MSDEIYHVGNPMRCGEILSCLACGRSDAPVLWFEASAVAGRCEACFERWQRICVEIPDEEEER